MTPKSGIEKAGLAFGLLVFAAYRTLEANAANGGGNGAADGWMLLLGVIMALMTFPLGGVVMFFLALLTETCESCQELGWALNWSTLMFVGYLQWFWLVPELRSRNRLTLLNLAPRAAAAGMFNGLRANAPTAAIQPPAATVEAVISPRKFDAEGRTPLERALDAAMSPALILRQE
ncbi:MAG: hypothetical protein ACRD9R_07590 [Pyrinomonadaceae bacterium]